MNKFSFEPLKKGTPLKKGKRNVSFTPGLILTSPRNVDVIPKYESPQEKRYKQKVKQGLEFTETIRKKLETEKTDIENYFKRFPRTVNYAQGRSRFARVKSLFDRSVDPDDKPYDNPPKLLIDGIPENLGICGVFLFYGGNEYVHKANENMWLMRDKKEDFWYFKYKEKITVRGISHKDASNLPWDPNTKWEWLIDDPMWTPIPVRRIIIKPIEDVTIRLIEELPLTLPDPTFERIQKLNRYFFSTILPTFFIITTFPLYLVGGLVSTILAYFATPILCLLKHSEGHDWIGVLEGFSQTPETMIDPRPFPLNLQTNCGLSPHKGLFSTCLLPIFATGFCFIHDDTIHPKRSCSYSDFICVLTPILMCIPALIIFSSFYLLLIFIFLFSLPCIYCCSIPFTEKKFRQHLHIHGNYTEELEIHIENVLNQSKAPDFPTLHE